MLVLALFFVKLLYTLFYTVIYLAAASSLQSGQQLGQNQSINKLMNAQLRKLSNEAERSLGVLFGSAVGGLRSVRILRCGRYVLEWNKLGLQDGAQFS